jgi:hypothetical protein
MGVTLFHCKLLAYVCTYVLQKDGIKQTQSVPVKDWQVLPFTIHAK